MKKRIAITIDVEAQPARAEKDHINRLIWGKHQGPRFGINLMMALADAHQIKVTHFLDYVECELYGEALLDVGREILLRGHDLQLHQHADFYSANFFARHSLTPEFDLVKADKKHCEVYMDYILQAHAQVTSQPALVYRGGGYRLGWPLLQTLKESGIRIDASYNPQHHRNPAGSSIRSSFCWPNGLFELPVPCLPNFRKRPIMPYNFNSPALLEGTVADCIQHHQDYLRAFFARHGDDAVATLVMHSWSFFKLDAKGFFTIRLDDAVEKYEALLGTLKQDYEFVSVGEIAADMEAELTRSKPETIALISEIHRCPICWEPVEHFKELNGVANRHCPVCKSVERQRVFQLLYASEAFGKNSLYNKTMLHIAPGAAEKTLFKTIYGLKTVSVDIRPEVHADMTADITSLKDVPDNSYDLVFASFVFTCTKEFAQAVKELHRVLKPFGILLCHDPLQIGKMTQEHHELESITAYYGEEAYKKYSIGSFRTFGELDYAQQFAPYFEGTVYAEKDPGTGADIYWLRAVRMHQAPAELDSASGKSLFCLLANHFCRNSLTTRGCVLSLGAEEEALKVLKVFFSACTQAQVLREKQYTLKKIINENGVEREVNVDFYQKIILITPGSYEGIASDSYDAVYAPFALQDPEERIPASRSLYRILRPGGCAILIHELEEAAGKNSRAELLAELSRLCESAGFTVRDASAIYAAKTPTICLLLIRDEQALRVDIENITAHMTASVPQQQVPGAQWTLLAERSFPYTLSVQGQRREYALIAQLPDMSTISNKTQFHFVHHGVNDELLGLGTGYLAFSRDFGLSWTRISVLGHEKVRFHKAFRTSSGKLIVQSVNPDWTSEALYLFDAEHTLISKRAPLSDYCWHGQHAIDEAGGVIMYADYSALRDFSQRLNMGGTIFRSKDGGHSWENVLSVQDIIHFHLVQHDPAKAHCWWACSGDYEFQCRWWFSADDGTTWQECTETLMNALHKEVPHATRSYLRTTNLCFVGNGLLWATDDSLKYKSCLLHLEDRFAFTGLRKLSDIGPLVRNIVQHEDHYILLTEGLKVDGRCLPEAWAFALNPFTVTRIAQIPSWSLKAKLSLSTASPHTVEGVFYSLRGWEDVFPGNLHSQILRWTVQRTV